MENEKYGIVFQAITDSFKAKMKELSNSIRNFGKKAEEETTIMPKMIDSGFTRRIEYVKRQMEDIYDSLSLANQREKEGKPAGFDVEKLRADYEVLSYKLKDLIRKQDEFNDSLEETNDEATETSSNLGNLFDKSISKIKRFSFYLLGARSVFSLFMKYQGIYYQYNEQLQYQSELSQNAIALSLAPAFEFLGNVIAYASIAFAKFIELLTGVNILSKVSTKGIRDYNKSLKETQTLVSGIDEITNLTMPSGTGLGSQYKALADFQKKIAEVEDFFKKNKWLFYLLAGAGIAGIIIKIGTSLVGGAGAIGTLGTAFGLSGTAGTGILGLAGALKFLAGLGAISIFIALAIPGIKHDMEEIAEKGFKQYFMETLNKVIKEELPNTFKTIYNLAIEWWLNPMLEKIKEDLKPIWQPIIDALTPVKEKITTKVDEIKENIKSSVIDVWNNSFGPIFGKIETNVTSTKDDTITALGEIKEEAENTFKDENIDIKYNVSADTTKATNSLTSLFRKFNLGEILGTGVKAVSSAFSSLFSPHANGLDYVPYDNYPALLHKGETVVPAKYNPTIHSVGNEYTNSLLEELVIATREQNNRPIQLDIDGHEFASATYPLYYSEEKRQNYSTKVRVK